MPRRAFTLVELLVVISIIGLLSTIAIVNLSSSRAKAKIAAGQHFSSSINNLISDQLVGEWLFNGSAADTSGKGNNGTLVGGPVAGSGYDGGGAYVLDGSSQYINVPSIPGSIFTNTSFTWSAWVKGSTNGVTNYMPTIGFASGSWFRLGFRQIAGVWEFDQILDGTHSNTIKCGPAVSSTEWVFLAVSAQYGGNVSCYQNGTLGGASAYVNDVTSGAPFGMGHCVGDAWASYIQGTIDDVRLYSTAATAMTVQKYFAEGLTSHPQSLAVITTP